jgi:hypothetical protein
MGIIEFQRQYQVIKEALLKIEGYWSISRG